MTSPQPMIAVLIAAGLLAPALAVRAQTLEKVAASNTMTVSYREAAVPFSYVIGTATPVGFAVDLTDAIVEDVRRALRRPALEVRRIPVTGQTRIPLLVDGSYDLECVSTTHTAAREKDVAFAISHFYAGTRLLTRKGSGIRNWADLAKQTVASAAGSTNEKVLRQVSDERRLEVQVVLGKDYAESMQWVESGRAAALALDDILLYGLIANATNPADWEVVGDTLQVEPYACMLRKDDPAFKALVDATLARLMKSGELTRLYRQWFESPIPPKGMALNMPMSDALKGNLRSLSDRPAP